MRPDLVSEATFIWLCRPAMATGLNLGLARVPGAVRSMEARPRNLFPCSLGWPFGTSAYAFSK